MHELRLVEPWIEVNMIMAEYPKVIRYCFYALIALVIGGRTMLEEATRKRFVFAYREQSSYSTVCFVKQAIDYFGYLPKVIQTDNGSEFTHTKPTKMIHPFDRFCAKLGIHHKLIRPRTPWHNGKVERSHRNDQERFYSFEDLQLHLRRYLYRSNNIPMAALGWKSPNQRQKDLGTKPGKQGL